MPETPLLAETGGVKRGRVLAEPERIVADISRPQP
jgi:hypothetical protein